MSGTDQITIRLPKARVAALRDAAKAQHRSLAQQVEHQLAAADSVADAPISPNKTLDVLLGRSTDTPEPCVTTDGPQLEARRFPKPEDAGSSPVGTANIPLTGTEFPVREVHQRGQGAGMRKTRS